MPPSRSFPAPSQALLRYLRTQSWDLGAGAPTPTGSTMRRHVCSVSGSKRRHAGPPRAVCPDGKSRHHCRRLGTTTRRREASGECSKGPDGPGRPTWWLTWWERFGGGPRHNKAPFGQEDMDQNAEDAISPHRSPAHDPRLRCTSVDENGKVIVADAEFKKSALIKQYGLLSRDLRKIDSSNLPHIIVRESAILMNLVHLKVLITHNRVLLLDAFGSRSSHAQLEFLNDLQHKLHRKESGTAKVEQADSDALELKNEAACGPDPDEQEPDSDALELKNDAACGPDEDRPDFGLAYELRALEAVLQSVTSGLEAELSTVRYPVLLVLGELEMEVTRDGLRTLLVLSKKLGSFEQKARLVRDAIDEVLEANDDLAAMYLTEKTTDIRRQEDDHNEVEMLLESYHKICDEVAQSASGLELRIRNAEEIMRAILDANRNSLMLLELKFSVGTLGLAMGTFLAGLYGMNLHNFLEESRWGFWTVTGVSSAVSALLCVYGMCRLRKVQRIKFANHAAGRGTGRGTDSFDHGADLLLDPGDRERLRKMKMQMGHRASAAKRTRRWWLW